MNGENSEQFTFPADEEFEFSLEDTIAQRGRTIGDRKGKPVVGYDPYDRKPGGKPPPPEIEPRRKPTDLRKLSEWIRLQREVEALKKEKSE